MRPDINHGDELRPRVREYATQRGLTMAEAWARIVREGLAAVEDSDNGSGQ